MPTVRTLVIALVILLDAGAAWSAPAGPVDVLQLSCGALQRSRGLCTGLQVALRPRAPRESREARLQRARRWAGQAAVQQQARALSRGAGRVAGRSVTQQLDLGLAQLLAGRIGEGMHHLLVAYQRAPQAGSTADAVYLGLLLSMDQLNPDQRIDWAADIAGRLTASWRLPMRNTQGMRHPPRAVEIARAIHLAELARDVEAIRQFVRFGQMYYPRDETWGTIARTLPSPKTLSAQRDTPRGDRY